MLGKGLTKGLGITLKHSLERDITVQYPEKRPFLQERYRGCLAFDSGKCIVCGICVKTCPNRVLSYQDVQRPGSKKKQIASFTIDLQYCMFCNLCVEACPTGTLYFTHDFERGLSERDGIKIIYDFTEALDFRPSGELEIINIDGPSVGHSPEPAGESPAEPGGGATVDEEAKILKKAEAFKTAIAKNSEKALSKLAGDPDDLKILIEAVRDDEKKQAVLAELMARDMEKAAKVAAGLINKARKDARKGEE